MSAAFFAFALPALAQVDLGLDYATQIGLTTTDVRTTIARIISYFLGFLGIVAVCIMLYAGFLWMTAGGNEEKVQAAKKWMINGVIGLIIIMSAFAITQFVLRAITGDAGLTSGGCLPGQQCGPGGGIGGGAGGFRVSGVAPAGPGPQNGGWPKNYSLTVGFNSEVVGTSVTASSFIVKKCNARIDGGGEAQPFNLNDCDTAVPGTRAVEGSRVVFKPNATPGDEPTDFEGEFWYYLQVVGGTVADTRGRTLLCPSVTSDISAQNAPSNLCDRAIAINNLRDVAPPTVEVNVPRSMPAYCAATIPVQAIGRDDFLVSRIDFSLDGATAGLSETSSVNGALDNPFSVDQIVIDASTLAIGEHFLAATAFDGVPQQSPAAQSRFVVPPANCCNAVQDPNETGIDCGPDSGCGECSGGQCTSDEECASGSCENGVCVELPIIESVSRTAAGPGTLITIRGRFFGAAAGQIIFMGPEAGTEDDKVAVACAEGAWRELSPEEPGIYEVVVAVPEGAGDGPLKVVTASGRTDTTEAEVPPGWVGAFDVTDQTFPGICRLTPSAGPAGSNVVISGSGFQDAQPSNASVAMGAQDVTVAGSGWSASAITAIVPSVRDGAYPVKVTIGAAESNPINFAVRPAAGAQKPEITAIVPDAASPGAYITVQGRGFGNAGTVRFFFGTDNPETGPDEREVAVGSIPACSDYWHNNYVVIKVPEKYASTFAVQRALHKVQIETVGPPQSSNLFDFTINNSVAGPGICSIMPPAGPAGVPVTLTGEGFGNVDILANPPGEDSVPENMVRFFKTASVNEPATAYSTWTLGAIGAVVPGVTSDPDSWPKTGPVSVVAANEASSNSVPFIVADCNAVGGDAFCAQQGSELICCETGACDTSCGPAARNSAFGWRFSTDVLPVLPRVVERATCSLTTRQSPSPYKNSIDACINTAIRLEFNTQMRPSTFTEANVTLEDCGDRETAACTGDLVDYNSGGMTGGETVFSMSPEDPLTQRHWYRVTLLSAPPVGITDTLGRGLDGNVDNVPGGNYSYTFRVRDSDQACALSSVAVTLPKFNIDHQGGTPSIQSVEGPDGFFADLLAANCNPLVCSVSGADQYNIDWSASATIDDDGVLALAGHPVAPAGYCDAQWQPVTASRETRSPEGVDLIAEGRRLTDQLRRRGTSDVTVKFSDPVVTHHAPDCDEACVNARVYALFNIDMDGSGHDGADLSNTLTTSNVRLFKCRNEACNAPYDVVPVSLSMIVPEVVSGYSLVRGVDIIPDVRPLEPNTFYLVRIRGGESGVKSSSGVPLKGLNDGDYYTWKFRTKNDGTPCSPNRSEITPLSAILQYDSQKLPFKVTPFGAPDECDALGQALTADDYSWNWSKTNEVIAGFLPNKDLPASRVNTEPGQNASCTALCLNAGSQNVEPQCGNGIYEPGEDCERVGLDFEIGCDTTSCRWNGVSAPACGNGTPDPGEQCDQKACAGGTSNEQLCSSSSDCPGGACEFIPGCKDPEVDNGDPDLDGKGCVWLGSSLGGSTCGDGFIADGEACDDGNKGNGDGCSADCLNEGTLPSCSTGVKPCVNFCGNGISEAGEDTGCDVGPGNVSSSCDQTTCLKKGTPQCRPGLAANCCGNGLVEASAGEECDDSEGCTQNCVNAGSSYLYLTPSFCRDSVTGTGEEDRCEVTDLTDTKIDPFQVIVGREPAAGGPGAPAENFMSTVTSTLPEITSPQNEGKAQVTLDRPCTTANQGICAEIGGAMVPPVALGCTPDGFCAEAPIVSSIYPGGDAQNVCRNTVVRVSFSRAMNALSVQNNMQVGEATPSGNCGFVCSNDNGKICTVNADCGDGGTCNVPRPTVGQSVALAPEAPQGGWLARLWDRVVSFVRGVLAKIAFAQAPQPADTGATYCLVPGTINVVGGVATWSPRNILAQNAWYRVFVNGGEPEAAKASNTVPLQNDYTSYFRTGPEICRIDFVTIDPESHLFSTSEDLGNGTSQDALDGDHRFTARAHPDGRGPEAEITTTPEYSFKWRWALQPLTSSIVVIPDTIPLSQANGWCEELEPDTSPDCDVNLAAAASPKPAAGCGNEVCESAESVASCRSDCELRPGHGAIATVKVRTGVCSTNPAQACSTNADCGGGTCQGSEGFPRNGDEVVQVTADISERRVLKSHVSASSDVVVLLCSNPWPARKFCPTSGADTGKIRLTWDRGPGDNGLACDPGTFVWYPFYDKERDTSFYYCRDAATGGAEGDLLPALREEIVSVTPGRDVLREYLFTFETPGPWQKDAVGFRIVTNGEHKGIRSWYQAQGFRGAPVDTLVDGYDALQEGRTVYVNAGSRVASSLYTNISILSYSDAAAPETVNIFNQFLGSIDMNRNVKDLNYCLDGTGAQIMVKGCSNNPAKDCTKDSECWEGTNHAPTCRPRTGQVPYPIACTSDRDCRTGTDGKAIAVRGPVCANDEARTCASDADCTVGAKCLSGYSCVASKSKLIRDVARWRDIHAMRDALLGAKSRGQLPTLESGSFLRARSNSQWPSWTALAGAVGGTPPVDPINNHLGCFGSGFDPVTCWNATSRLYQCPKDSHVYEFQSVGGQDFRLRVDFEARCEQYKRQAACVSDPLSFCNWIDIADGDPLTGTCNAAASWAGSTCVEKKNQPDCIANSRCLWDAPNSACIYKEGGIELGGVNNIAGVCQSTTVSSETGICGDTVVQAAEQCEPTTPADVASCTVSRVCRNNPGVGCTVNGDCGTGPGAICDDVADRTGSHKRNCTLNCTWGAFDACKAGVCGDGVIQSPESCDDGAQNGTFGHCRTDCAGFGPFCGDGQKEINEACDCSEKNGAYDFNGKLTGVNTAVCRVAYPLDTSVLLNSCAWDCSGAGPYCGDGVINGPEQCDGGFEEFKGFCDDPLQTGCDSNAQCNFGSCVSGRCSGNASVTCTSDTECAKTCGSYCPTVEQRNRRICGNPLGTPATQVNNVTTTTDDPAAGRDPARDPDIGKSCRWSGWSCTAPGSCGNGVKETGEECDDGNTDNTDGCIIDPANGYFCRTARCADGYISTTNLETCDLGANNGRICAPQYGLDCNYCTSQCRTGTVSGGFCGNNLIEDGTRVPPGPEECEGTQGMAEWICTSTKIEYLSMGKIFSSAGNPRCAINNCKRTCDEPQTKLCYNNPGSANTDGDTSAGLPLRDACDPDVDNDAVPGVFDCRDSLQGVHPAYAYPKPAGENCPSVAPETPPGSGQCKVAAGMELCDNEDNDCNGQTDESVMVVHGKVKNGATNAAIPNAQVKAYCMEFLIGRADDAARPEPSTLLGKTWGTIVRLFHAVFGIAPANANHTGDTFQLLAQTTSDGSGNYRLDVPVNLCGGSQIMIEATPPGGTCFGPTPTTLVLTKEESCVRPATDDLLMGETMTITGTVRNARTGSPVGAGVLVKGYCGAATGSPQNTTTTNSSGNYSLVLYKTGCSEFAITAGDSSAGSYCESPSAQSVTVAPGCGASGAANPIVAAPRPSAGGMLIYVTWGSSPGDLDFHMRTSAGECMGYRCGGGYGSAAGATWDLDDTNGNGPETITINSLVASRKYRFYVHNYSGGSFQSNMKMQLWNSSCSNWSWDSSAAGGSASNRFWNVFTFQAANPASGAISITEQPNVYQAGEPGAP